jgi:hypothetical protein
MLTAEEKMRRSSDYERLTSVQKTLIHCNILRRHRIAFITKSRSTRKRFNIETAEPQVDIRKEVDTFVKGSSSVAKSSRSQQQPPSISISRAPQQTVRKEAPSVTHTLAPTATDVGSQLDISRLSPGYTPSKATNLTRIGAKQAYPRCPRPNQDRSLICPYCDDVLPPSYAKVEKSWK